MIETSGAIKWAKYEVRITTREEGGLGRDALGNTIRLPPSQVAEVVRVDYWHTLRPSFATVAGLLVGGAAFVGISVLSGGGLTPAVLSLPWMVSTGGSCARAL